MKKLKTESVMKLDLLNGGYAKGLIKELVKRFGINFNRLQAICNCKYIRLDLQYKLLRGCGSKGALDKMRSIVEEISTEMMATSVKSEDTLGDCSICFSSVEKPDEVYYLQLCDHLFCLECAQGLVAHCFDNNTVPIVCPQEGCNKPLCVDDINSLKKGEYSIENLFLAAKRLLLQTNTDYLECPTPDCSGVVKRPNLVCYTCNHGLCSKCSKADHPGVECSTLSALDKDLWKLVMENPDKYKICKKCSSPVEKIEGCNHMTCSQCNSHFCWKCLKIFPDANSTYIHLGNCGGLYG